MGLEKNILRLACTIGPVEAGIIDTLANAYEAKTGVKIVFEGAGTGKTLEKAKTGAFDLVISHAKKLEEQFIAEAYGLQRHNFMYNDFILLGPTKDPAGIKGMKRASWAMFRIARTFSFFVSRGDNSGTHQKEMELWEEAGVKVFEGWHKIFADGYKGNKALGFFADQKEAYTLIDRASWLKIRKEIRLVPLVEGDESLLNFMVLININPQLFDGINAQGADNFIK